MYSLLGISIAILSVYTVMQTDYFDPQPLMSTPPVAALYKDKTQPIEARVADLLSYMTLEEKIGQMTLVEKDSLKESSDIATYYLGALLSGAGAKPEENTPRGWKDMIVGYQAEAARSRLKIPLFYGNDAVHGHAHVPGATVFPHAIGLGATNNPSLVHAIARATAEELSATGVNWNFSPNLDQPQDIRWGRVYETFSDDPALVSKLGVAYVEGLQTPAGGDGEPLVMLATPKHYLGLGGMRWGTSINEKFNIDQGSTMIDDVVLRNAYVPPFAAAIDAGTLSIMVGLNKWGEKPMVRQKELLTDLLKEELGYKGFLVSDWYGIHEGRDFKFLATVQAINAGVDMAMLPFDYAEFAAHVRWANRLGLISDARINDAVGRILYAKFALGLFDEVVSEVPLTHIGSVENRQLARDAVAESLVLLKNEDSLLPLSANIPSMLVAGSAADNVGMQMGGWSIEWQGVDGNWIPGATSILAGIKEKVSEETTLEYDELGNFTGDKRAAVGIAIVGETPYAEGAGDREYPILYEEDLQAIKNLQARCEKVIVVIVSGRPLLIKNELATFDALVAAWLPGSEGGGVADGLFGDIAFTGTLPLPWPAQAEQLPITKTGVTADGTPVLFERYFGLR